MHWSFSCSKYGRKIWRHVFYTHFILKGLGRLPKMNSCILNWSTGKETSAPLEMPNRAGLCSVIFPKNAPTSMEAGWAWGGHEFPSENQVCFTVNEVRDIKSKPAPLLTKLTSAPQVLIKFQPSSLLITVSAQSTSAIMQSRTRTPVLSLLVPYLMTKLVPYKLLRNLILCF